MLLPIESDGHHSSSSKKSSRPWLRGTNLLSDLRDTVSLQVLISVERLQSASEASGANAVTRHILKRLEESLFNTKLLSSFVAAEQDPPPAVPAAIQYAQRWPVGNKMSVSSGIAEYTCSRSASLLRPKASYPRYAGHRSRRFVKEKSRVAQVPRHRSACTAQFEPRASSLRRAHSVNESGLNNRTGS
jgi:hypothetical protein